MKTRLRRSVTIVGLLAFLTATIRVDCSHAQSEAIDRGVAYLMSQQSHDGTWSPAQADEFNHITQIIDTVAVFKALVMLNRSEVVSLETLRHIVLFGEDDAHQIASKLSGLVGQGVDSGSLIDKLSAMRNSDGGWGIAGNKQSNVLDTLLVVDALLQAQFSDHEVLRKARDYLVSRQHIVGALGSWSHTDETIPPDIALTAMAVMTLRTLDQEGLGSSSAHTAIERGRQFLASQIAPVEDPDEGYVGSTLNTALTYRAIAQLESASSVQSSLAWLLAHQQTDGSWDNSVHTTAAVLQALAIIQPPQQDDLPDLMVHSQAITFDPETLTSGSSITMTATVFNIGKVDAEDVTVEFFNRDPRLGGTRIGDAQLISRIPPGGSVDKSIVYDDTADLHGQQTIVVMVDYSGTISETSELNNIAYRQLTVTGTPDLVVNDDELDFAQPDGDTAQVVAVIRNDGTDTAFDVVVHFTKNNNVLTGGTIDVGDIPAKSSKIAVAEFTVPGVLGLGNHTIKVIADPSDLIDEGTTGEDNNEGEIDITLDENDRPDLSIAETNISFDPSSPAPGSQLVISAKVINSGSASSLDAFKVLFGLGESVFGGTIIQDNIQHAGVIVSGGSATITATWNAVHSGNHTVFVFIDRDREISEENENNNIAFKNLSTTPAPDLAVHESSINVSHTSIDAGQSVVLSARIDNLGNAAASGAIVTFAYRSVGSEGPLYLIGKTRTDEIAAGASRSASVLWLPSMSDSTQSYEVHVLVDNINSEIDANGSNDVAHKNYTFTVASLAIQSYRIEVIDNVAVSTATDSFDASDMVEIHVLSPFTADDIDISARMQPLNEGGELTGEPVVLPGVWKDPAFACCASSPLYYGRFRFSIGNMPAGDYRIDVQVQRISNQGQLSPLLSGNVDITVNSSLSIHDASIYPTPFNLIKQAESQEVALNIRVINDSTTSTPVVVRYVVREPDSTMLAEGSSMITIEYNDRFSTQVFATINVPFTKPGTYRLEAQVWDASEETMLAQALGSLSVDDTTRLSITQTITPTVVDPIDGVKARVRIEIKREDD